MADAILAMPLPEIEVPPNPRPSGYRGTNGSGTSCSICTSFEREEIEQWIVVGRSHRDTARRFKVNKDAVHRHKQHHMPALEADRAMRETLSKANAVARLQLAMEVHEHSARELSASRDHRDATAAAKNLADSAKLAGQIGGWFVEKQQVTGIIGTIDFNRLLADIMRELAPWPQALAVVDTLLAGRELEASLLE